MTSPKRVWGVWGGSSVSDSLVNGTFMLLPTPHSDAQMEAYLEPLESLASTPQIRYDSRAVAGEAFQLPLGAWQCSNTRCQYRSRHSRWWLFPLQVSSIVMFIGLAAICVQCSQRCFWAECPSHFQIPSIPQGQNGNQPLKRLGERLFLQDLSHVL